MKEKKRFSYMGKKGDKRVWERYEERQMTLDKRKDIRS